ncbi:MAG: translocation/assembly module TamB domain-containing protein [Campylobacterales bacterium]|nr:translocation/assembly module TamB domain-containing protein [Campylobacterales bacterium]
MRREVIEDHSSWLKKVLIYAILFFVALGSIIYFIANSSWVIQKAAQKFAHEYHITYTDISGNAFSGIEIDDPAFMKKPLAKRITIKWNPNALLQKKILITKLEIERADVDTIKALIASFDTNGSESSEPFDFMVELNDVLVSIDPFTEKNINFSFIRLNADSIAYRYDGFELINAQIFADSNLTKLIFEGSFTDRNLDIMHLELNDVNTTEIVKMLQGTQESNITSSSDTSESIFLPKRVYIGKLITSLQPYEYQPVKLEQTVLNADDVMFDLEKLSMERGNVELNVTTNLSNALYRGTFKDNAMIGTLHVVPTKYLFEYYDLPLRKEAFGEIRVDFNASKEQVVANLKANATEILQGKKDDFNIDINDLRSHIVYQVADHSIQADSHALITTPYAKDINISNTFRKDENITYEGEIKAANIIGMDAKLAKPIGHPTIAYHGDKQSIYAKLDADNVQGDFNSSDLKKGFLHLETKRVLKLAEMIQLPQELQEANGTLKADIPISFDADTTVEGTMKIGSNLANIDARIVYGKTIEIELLNRIPDDSLMRPFYKTVKWDAFNPTKIMFTIGKETVDVRVESSVLKASADYRLKSSEIKGKLSVGGMDTDIKGILNKQFGLNIKAQSLQALMKNLQSVYTFEEIPKIEGSADIHADVKGLKKAEIRLTSSKLYYEADRKTTHTVSDVSLQGHIEGQTLTVEKYAFIYDKQKFFATRSSNLTLDGDIIKMGEFWVNDQLKNEGSYNLTTQKGRFSSKAERLHIVHESAEFDSKIDLETSLDGNQTDIKGQIVLLGGNVYYDAQQKSFAGDDDIIMVQELKKKKQNSFMENLSTMIQVKTKEPLIYKQGDIDVQISADLGVYKSEHAPLTVVGSVEIPEGGSYQFEDKKFIFKKSHLYFTGKPSKPIIDATLTYKSLNYLITIAASGTPDAPIINFSSSPSLTREQILAVILFDSEEAAGTNNGDDMMRMMGGAMAKSVLSNAGLKIDHLVLGAGNSVEVGKKLTDDITIIYVNGEVASVKLKYRHTEHTESVIEASEVSQSYDIIYKRDF